MSQLYLKIYIPHISIWINDWQMRKVLLNAIIISIHLNVIILYIMMLIHPHYLQNLRQNLSQDH